MDPGRLQKAYRWLNDTFKWRPVFDWDSLMIPESYRDSDLETAYSNLKQQYGLEIAAKDEGVKPQNDVLILEIAKQFRCMREGGIPVHVLVGRRHPDTSSLYWGWPYERTAWEKSLDTPFDSGLMPVAMHIDTLSILYDLRNPLDEERLQAIDARQPYHAPDAYCPRRPCPWKDTNNCPFRKQWDDKPSRKPKAKPKPSTQKMANEKGAGKAQPHLCLASNLISCPPTGEYAEEDTSDDIDTKNSASATLHQLARRAAYEREALGWQRFWAEYAPKLINLTELRIRMPHCFDQVGSWELLELLNPKQGWKVFTFADERQHMQTHEDLMHLVGAATPSLYSHSVQEKVWPAGRFVRRTWVSYSRMKEGKMLEASFGYRAQLTRSSPLLTFT
jgi:hypothetical protein